MQFIVIARDGTDGAAPARRQKVRTAHLALSDEAIARGEQLMGAALLNDAGEMCGSIMLVEFPDRAALDTWLEREPYVTGDVWKEIEVHAAQLGPSFAHLRQNS